MEHALERVGNVDADAGGAVERARQVATLVGYALGLLRVLLIDPVTRFIRRVRTIGQKY